MRIMIIGNCGAGKSTFAQQLGKKLQLPVVHLDTHYWLPGWQRRSHEEWENIMKNLVQQESWIIDGNYQSSMEMRLQRADIIIFFDTPKVVCLWRVIKRFISSTPETLFDKPQVGKERLSWDLVWWIIRYPRKETLQNIEKYKNKKRVFVIKNTPGVLELYANLLT